jgi:hypothetical protein
MYFIDSYTGNTYIEEITGGHLARIEDDKLWEALARFIHEKGLDAVDLIANERFI